MFKWIILMVILYSGIWYFVALYSNYTPISKQIDVKTMSIKKPSYIILKRNTCVWTCRNYSSSSSSRWGGSSWWK